MKASDITIVMPYHNRKKQFYLSLTSIQNDNEGLKPNIIILDDCSNDENKLNQEELNIKYDGNIKLLSMKKENKDYSCCCVLFNILFSFVETQIIMISNPEIYHCGNLTQYVIDNLTDENYIVFSCLSSKDEDLDVDKTLKEQELWYTHPVIRPYPLHFTSAIMTKHIKEIGGFDLRYSNGSSFDDNEILHRIKLKGLIINHVETPIVIHQHHSFEESNFHDNELYDKNHNIFKEKTLKEETFIVNNGKFNVDKYLKEI